MIWHLSKYWIYKLARLSEFSPLHSLISEAFRLHVNLPIVCYLESVVVATNRIELINLRRNIFMEHRHPTGQYYYIYKHATLKTPYRNRWYRRTIKMRRFVNGKKRSCDCDFSDEIVNCFFLTIPTTSGQCCHP